MTARKDPRPTKGSPEPMVAASGAPKQPRAKLRATPTHLPSEASTSRRARYRAMPMPAPRGGTNSARPISALTEPVPAASDASNSPATKHDVATKSAPSRGSKQADRHVPSAAHGMGVVGSGVPDPTASSVTPPTGPSLLDPALLFAASILDDLENVRKANENRLRQMTRAVEDKDGEIRGLGYDESHPDVAWMAALVETITKAEHQAVLNLQRQLRKHPLHNWVKAQRGVGEKQAARLLAAIGDPYLRPEWLKSDGTVVPEGPRTVSALWAYCGLHVLPVGQPASDAQTSAADGNGRDPGQDRYGNHSCLAGVAPKRQRGQQTNWNETARMRLWNVADKVKQSGFDKTTCTSKGDSDTGQAVHGPDCGCGHYRLVYDAAREKYAKAVHTAPCVRCGPKGKPAAEGSPLSDGHKNARAVRIVMKEIAKDLWREAKRLHELHDDPGHASIAAQATGAEVAVPNNSPAGLARPDAQHIGAGRNQLPDGHTVLDAHRAYAVGGKQRDTDHEDSAAHLSRVGVAPKPKRTRKAA